MGLDFAIDELYSSGWSDLAPANSPRHHDGRAYPSVAQVRAEFAEAGCELRLRHIQLFDCTRAEWFDGQGASLGAVVGQHEAEAAVYALSQFRRSMAMASA
jgi:hypothetical protein